MTKRWVVSLVVWVLLLAFLVLLPVPIEVMAFITIPLAVLTYIIVGKPPWLS